MLLSQLLPSGSVPSPSRGPLHAVAESAGTQGAAVPAAGAASFPRKIGLPTHDLSFFGLLVYVQVAVIDVTRTGGLFSRRILVPIFATHVLVALFLCRFHQVRVCIPIHRLRLNALLLPLLLYAVLVWGHLSDDLLGGPSASG